MSDFAPGLGPYLPRLFVALDTTHLDKAVNLARSLSALEGVGVKLGMEFYAAHGPQGVRKVAGELPLFLDAKLHDIPNTVHGAVRAAASIMRPTLITVHGAGGRTMLAAAREAAEEAAEPPKIVAVTVLTSLDDADVAQVGIQGPIEEQVARLTALAADVNLDGVICSGREIPVVRRVAGPPFAAVVPGIRPDGAEVGDQKRVLTPAQAFDAGATAIVVGRPITTAADPAAAAKAILDETRGPVPAA